MNVIATQRGFYGGRVREDGEAFSLSDPDHFSERWMKKGEAKAESATIETELHDEPTKRGPGRPRKEA
jgi:hypothetical protein